MGVTKRGVTESDSLSSVKEEKVVSEKIPEGAGEISKLRFVMKCSASEQLAESQTRWKIKEKRERLTLPEWGLNVMSRNLCATEVIIAVEVHRTRGVSTESIVKRITQRIQIFAVSLGNKIVAQRM